MARGLLFLLAVAIVTLLFLPGLQSVAAGLLPVPWDKLAHFVLFATLTVLLGLATDAERAWPLAVAVGLIGALDEWHQTTVPDRSGDLIDLLVDWLAAGVAAAAFTRWRSWRRKRRQTLPMPPISGRGPSRPVQPTAASSRRKQ